MDEIEIISEVIEQTKGVLEANKKSLIIPSNIEEDRRLQTDEWKKYKSAYAVWTGTLVATRKDNAPFEETLEFRGIKFRVPEKFRGKSGILAVNHPDFLLNGNTYTPGDSAKLLKFPKENGWYKPESDFGIPNGKPSERDDNEARYLWRRDAEDFVGLLVRWGGYGDDRRDVGCNLDPDVRLGVLGKKQTGKLPEHTHEWVTTCVACGVTRGKE